VERYLKLFTLKTADEIGLESATRVIRSSRSPEALAKDITSLVHGDKALAGVVQASPRCS